MHVCKIRAMLFQHQYANWYRPNKGVIVKVSHHISVNMTGRANEDLPQLF